MSWGLVILVSVWVFILVCLYACRNVIESTIDPTEDHIHNPDEDDFLP